MAQRTLAEWLDILGVQYSNHGDYTLDHSDTTYTMFVSRDGFQGDVDDLDRPCVTYFYDREVDGSDPADDRRYLTLRAAFEDIFGRIAP